MNDQRKAHHLNCLKMCESDYAIEKCIIRIFEEGAKRGWEEAEHLQKVKE